MSKTLLAFDPGATTGIAAIRCPSTVLWLGEAKHDEQAAAIEECLDVWQPDTVIVEAFRPHPGKAVSLTLNDLPAAREIGVIRHLCGRRGIDVVMQEASCKAFFRPALLKAVLSGCAHGIGDHAKDALRHALYYAWFRIGCVNSPDVQAVLHKYAGGKGVSDARDSVGDLLG